MLGSPLLGSPMLGVVETALFLVPIAVYAIWRVTAVQGGPSSRALIAGVTAVVILGASLVWYVRAERIDPTATYIPPRIEDGRLIPGHAMPK